MDNEQFVKIVEQQIGRGAEAAERAVQATLQTLTERLSKGQRRDMMRELPPETMRWLHTEKDPEPFDVDEFLRRVAEREGLDVETAERHARAVFWAIGQAASASEVEDLAADLPHDFAPLVAEAQRRFADVVPAEQFLDTVAERTGLDPEGARRATDAVLETLAERIASGEVEDLVSQLPVQLHAPLKRGMAGGSGDTKRMSVEEFLRRIAEREGVTPEVAREHARAVFATLRESISEEFFDVTAQLPNDYWILLPRP
jgi:uncharacterized protein (DUF2267 family)